MDFVAQIESQTSSLRSSALEAGPDAPVPSCPEWTVLDLVRHIAEVHTWAAEAVVTGPAGSRPAWPQAPQDFDDVFSWWDNGFSLLVDRLRETPADRPAWTFQGPGLAGFWARRQAHETSIHRLDADLATGRELPPLAFDPEFAADGVDEYLTVLVGRRIELGFPVTATGRLLVHAADAGRTWELRLTEGEPLVVAAPRDSAFEEDATLAGTADAIYRFVYGRPSHAIVTGDESLLAGLPRP
ncbi:maleylpyruvate isomerase N-terminal domain-containing protein [Lentzea sp. DG1S-22]|uniref:maleylpyruvate isomerase N-terminal domain-containing protein n=1 Tax=Lentzea sp. DG1S-22 TaxID=3108822 RepID=UPI002E78AF03|nr:maleylpyruvate isomerase N-terminal domain-containing protein [Lentzea sp. DG1S-22]WVH79279.1 maleylpyruvate isomerase N-terminal domain-containing protein [Lentzea sp. DG1S-22]